MNLEERGENIARFTCNLQMETGSLGWEDLSCSRAGIMVFKAELKSTNRIYALVTEESKCRALSTDLLSDSVGD